MRGFSSVERRISANETQTRFRVQYKDKKGKAKGKVLKTIEEARALRDKTDIPGAAKKALNISPTPKAKKDKPGIQLLQLDLESTAISITDKLKLIKEYTDTVSKILAL